MLNILTMVMPGLILLNLNQSGIFKKVSYKEEFISKKYFQNRLMRLVIMPSIVIIIYRILHNRFQKLIAIKLELKWFQ